MNFIKTLYNTSRQSLIGSKLLYQQSKQVRLFIRDNPDTNKWTRSDYLLVHRVNADVRKSAAFGLVLLLLPEVIPLILARGINVLPSVFLTSDQKLALEQKLAQNRLDIAKKWISTFPDDIRSHAKVEPQHYLATSFKRTELKEFAKLFDLAKFGTSSMITNRISTHTEYLQKDDEYLKKMDLKDLTAEQLDSALSDRGISRHSRSDSECIRILEQWVEQDYPSGIMILKVKTAMILNHQNTL